jgi:hypothetical protein
VETTDTLTDPSGQYVGSWYNSNNFSATLQSTGTYNLFVDPYLNEIGTVTSQIFAYTVPNPASVTASPDGGSVQLSTTTPGQTGQITFSGMAGQTLIFWVQSLLTSISGQPSGSLSLLDPNGNVIRTTSIPAQGVFSFDAPRTLATTGTYALKFSPVGPTVGTISVTILNVPAPLTASATIDGGQSSITTNSAGQDASFTFSGTSGQVVEVQLETSF